MEKNLGIYIHVPFCRSKCEYCDFYSLSGGRTKELMDKYLHAVTEHIREAAALAPEYVADSVYFGGGTPRSTAASSSRGTARSPSRPTPTRPPPRRFAGCAAPGSTA